MRTIFSSLFGFALCGLFSSAVVLAADTPLIQPGKKTLVQRVLTTPSCKLMLKPGDQTGAAQEAFTRYYVYERKQVAGVDWLEVGPSSKRTRDHMGWLNAKCAIDWNMQMSLAFTNPAGRDLSLLFKDKQSIEKILDSSEPEKLFRPIQERLKQNNGVHPNVLAVEPELYVDFKKNFYLLPILESAQVTSDAGMNVRLLQVASITKNEPIAAAAPAPNSIKAFNAGVVFVLDTTISMDPYIERTREAVRTIYGRMEQENLDDKVKFGLVSFRSSIKAVPGLEYVSKMYVDPTKVKDGSDFLAKIKDLKATRVSSAKFDEDPYAGLKDALTNINWNEFGARYIVLVTDAGAIDGNDPLSSTGLDARAVREIAKEKGVAIYVLHLRSPEGIKNHASAQRQYQTLSFNDVTNSPLYYPVNAGSVSVFGQVVESLGQSLVTQIKLASTGDMVPGSALTAAVNAPTTKVAAPDAIARDAVLIGKAMQLAFRGEKENAQAPPVIKAWISDRDLIKQNLPATEVRVLLTKAQLSDLSKQVQEIADAANASMVSPTEMFERLRSVAANMGRDPNRLNTASAQTLGKVLLDEYLEGLPYKSDVLNLDEEMWKSMSVTAQSQLIMRLNVKLRQYQIYNADVNAWQSLAKNSDPSDNVYPIPLESLP
jgi:serine/threonine-protein kinase PpkA